MKRRDIMLAGGAALVPAAVLRIKLPCIQIMRIQLLANQMLRDKVLANQVLAHPVLSNQLPPNPARSRPAFNPAPIWTMATVTRKHLARLARHAGGAGNAARQLVSRARHGGAAGLRAPDASRCMHALPFVPRAAVAAITAHRRDLTGRMPGFAQFRGICRA